MVRQPQQARHGAERQGLSRDLVYLGFEAIVVDLLKLRHFAAGAGIDVGAGPDGLAVAVIENDAFAHRTAGDGLNIGGREPSGVERLANALAGQLPVGGKVELHRARDVINAQVFPFGLAYRQLAAIKIENNRPNAAGPGI